jgi:transposase
MVESTTVTVGLDIHASSIRLAAVRADELLEERTLAYDEEGVERALRRWPRVRCCYEAGPTGFGLYRHLCGRGIDCEVVAPGLVPSRPGDRVKTDPRDARKLARLLAGGLLEPIWVPPPELEAARDLVRAREDARLDRMRDRHRLSKFCLRHGLRLPGRSWGITRRRWLSERSFGFPAGQQAFDTYVHALDLVDHRIAELERAIAETAAHGPWRELVAKLRCLRGIDTLTALGLAVEIGDFGRFRPAEEFMAFVGRIPPAGSATRARSPRSATRTCAACSSSPPGTGAGGRPWATSSPAASAARTRSSSSGPGAASSASTAAGCGWPLAASPRRRSSSPARESSPASSGRSRPSNRSETPERESFEQRMRPTTRRTLEASLRHRPPVTRDPRPRQLPTVSSHPVPTRECQCDPPSLPRAIRRSRTTPKPTDRASPPDVLLHVRGLM